MVTDNQIAKQREKNESLRKEIATLNANRLKAENTAANEGMLARLKQEEAGLQTELEYQRRVTAGLAARTATDTPDSTLAVGTNIEMPVESVPPTDAGDEKKEK